MRRQNSWPRPAITLPPDHPPPYPPPLAGEGRVGGTSAVSSHDIFSKEIFETIWSSEHRSPVAVPEQRTEPRRETRTRSAESKSPPLSPAQAAASASRNPAHCEPPPLPIIKPRLIHQLAY